MCSLTNLKATHWAWAGLHGCGVKCLGLNLGTIPFLGWWVNHSISPTPNSWNKLPHLLHPSVYLHKHVFLLVHLRVSWNKAPSLLSISVCFLRTRTFSYITTLQWSNPGHSTRIQHFHPVHCLYSNSVNCLSNTLYRENTLPAQNHLLHLSAAYLSSFSWNSSLASVF